MAKKNKNAKGAPTMTNEKIESTMDSSLEEATTPLDKIQQGASKDANAVKDEAESTPQAVTSANVVEPEDKPTKEEVKTESVPPKVVETPKPTPKKKSDVAEDLPDTEVCNCFREFLKIRMGMSAIPSEKELERSFKKLAEVFQLVAKAPTEAKCQELWSIFVKYGRQYLTPIAITRHLKYMPANSRDLVTVLTVAFYETAVDRKNNLKYNAETLDRRITTKGVVSRFILGKLKK